MKKRFQITYGCVKPNTCGFSQTLTRDGQPRRRAGKLAGAASQDARRSKQKTYPELPNNQHCRFVVLAIKEVAWYVVFDAPGTGAQKLETDMSKHINNFLKPANDCNWSASNVRP